MGENIGTIQCPNCDRYDFMAVYRKNNIIEYRLQIGKLKYILIQKNMVGKNDITISYCIVIITVLILKKYV